MCVCVSSLPALTPNVSSIQVTDAGSDEMNLGDPDTGLNNLGTSKAKPGKNKVCSGQVTFTYRGKYKS